jgi:soluble lytic murein transglycosylase-like protein
MNGFGSGIGGNGGRASALASRTKTLAVVAATVLLLVALGGASVQEATPTPGASGDAPSMALRHPLAAGPDVPAPAHDALGADVSRRFRIAGDAAYELVGAARLAGQSYGIDPLLVLAVIAVESRFNPIAESDYGARGLMQIVPRFHPEKVPGPYGERALLDPWTNIHVGTRILREYLDGAGSLEAALQRYGGAAEDPDRAYARKVLGELERFRRAEAAAARGTSDRAS